MRRPEAPSERGDGAEPLPDLSQLTISPPTPSLLLGDGQVEPDSPYPLATPLPDVAALPVSPQRAPARRPPRAETASAPPAINVVVHATRAKISINENPPSSPRKSGRGYRAQTPATPSASSVSESVSAGEAFGGQEASPAPSFTMRGGGKVIPWNAALEHIAPRDPRHTQKWYVITAGLRVGIWKSWLAMEDYIDVEGRRYQSYPRHEDAEKDYYDAKREGRVRLLIR